MDRNFIEERNHLNYVLQRIDDKVDYLACNKPYSSVRKYAVAHSSEEIEDLQYKKESNEYSDSQISAFNSFKGSPYFARMDLEYNDGGIDTETEKIYIGKKSLIIDYDQLVYDWRSPIGQRYYLKNEIKFRHDKYNYTLLLRRGINIKEGKLLSYNDEYVFGEEIFSKGITDPFLVKALKEKRHEHRMTDIIKSIQENQNIIIRQPINKSFIVQGCAGSGKTMILLHRLSYLIFNNKNLNPNNIKIITPNENFNININELSNELGLDKIERLTVTDYYIKLINKYDKTLLRNAEISLNESIIDSKFLNDVYSESFYKNVENIYLSFMKKLLDKQILFGLKNICLIRNFDFEINENLSNNYKIENYKNYIKNILSINLSREQELNILENKLKNSIDKIEDLKENTNEHSLLEQIGKIESELAGLSKDIRNDLIILCNAHEIKEIYEINIQDLSAYIKSILSKNKNLNEKYNKILNDIEKLKTSIQDNANDVILLSDKINSDKKQLENDKRELDDTTFYNFFKRRRLGKNIKNLEKSIKNNSLSHKSLLDKEKLYAKNMQLLNTEGASIYVKLLSEDEFNKMNNYYNKLTQLKTNLDSFKNKLYEIQLNKEKDIKKLNVDIDLLKREAAKLKQIVLSDEEQNNFENYADELMKANPLEIYKRTIGDVLLMKMQEYDIEKTGIIFKFDLYMKLLFCILFYGRVQNYDTFLNIDEGQDFSAAEYNLFNLANGGNIIFNIYGDINQRISSKGISNWNQVTVAKNNFVLNENYRNTKEITNYCNKLLNINTLPIGVAGEDVNIKQFSEALAEIKIIAGNKEKDRCAIIIDSRSSDDLSNTLVELGCLNNKIMPGKISVLTVEQSKGLEFDCVYVYDKYMNKNEKYISYTRALKKLVIFN